MSTQAVGNYTARNRRRRAAKRADRITDVEVMAEDGWSLVEAATHFGWPPRRLTRYLDGQGQSALVEALLRNTGARS